MSDGNSVALVWLAAVIRSRKFRTHSVAYLTSGGSGSLCPHCLFIAPTLFVFLRRGSLDDDAMPLVDVFSVGFRLSHSLLGKDRREGTNRAHVLELAPCVGNVSLMRSEKYLS